LTTRCFGSVSGVLKSERSWFNLIVVSALDVESMITIAWSAPAVHAVSASIWARDGSPPIFENRLLLVV
jgi:hypothetical protein